MELDRSIISVKDKVILITGALGLIGKELSKCFLVQDAKVIISDLNLLQQDEFINSLSNLGIKPQQFEIIELDITNEESCKYAINKAIAKFGKIDVLINNAAIDAKYDPKKVGIETSNDRFENYSINSLIQSVNVNLIGTILITQNVCKQMLTQGFGNIINVASTYSLVSPNQNLYKFGDYEMIYKPIDYVASKSFIPNFTRYVATLYAREGIRCNAIVPHGIFNNHSNAFIENWEKLSPIGRMCQKEELHGPFTFLASDSSSYMTGALLSVDGGWTAW